VLVSRPKRCGKTTVLILLYYLTPRAELASNISASAIFRYIEEARPTLLIDEADIFVKDNEEMRGGSTGRHSPQTRTTAESRNSRSGSGDASEISSCSTATCSATAWHWTRLLPIAGKLTVVRILCCRRRRLNHRTDSGLLGKHVHGIVRAVT